MTDKVKYSLWIGLVKSVKNNLVVLIPFCLAVLASLSSDLPLWLAPIASFLSYFLKNLYETKTGK